MTTEQLNVSGMTYGGCVGNVMRALSAVPGEDKVDVSLPKHTVTVKFDQARTSLDAMRTAVHSAGYDVVETFVKTAAGGCCGAS